jgi:hypothetical protein
MNNTKKVAQHHQYYKVTSVSSKTPILSNTHDDSQVDDTQQHVQDDIDESYCVAFANDDDGDNMDANASGGGTEIFELSNATLECIPGETTVLQHTVKQEVHLELLNLLTKAEAPDYLFQSILQWACKAHVSNYNFIQHVTSRNVALREIESHLCMQTFRPQVHEIELESVDGMLPVVSFDFKKQLYSLLSDSLLMDPGNMVLNDALWSGSKLDVSPWFQPYCYDATTQHPCKLDEILSGHWYRETVAEVNDPKAFICPIILYVDKTFIDPMRS